MNSDDKDENTKALKRLRELPRGTNVDARIAGIRGLLNDREVFQTLKALRWPQGVICPRCQSVNVIRSDPPPNAIDKRHYYECLDCKNGGRISDFDDFTGLPLKSMHAVKQWILCWYLIGFCSVNQIAKILGISAQEVMQMAHMGNEITELPKEEDKLKAKENLELSKKKIHDREKTKASVERDEDYTKSESKSPLKPGYKSKK